MPTFIVDDNEALEPPFALRDEDEHHLIRSLRARPGDKIRLTNNRGAIAECEITATTPLSLQLLHRFEGAKPLALCIGLPLISPERLEWAAEKLAELNVAAIQLIATARCQTRDFAPSRLKRLEKIIRQAQQQCGRAWPLQLHPPRGWQEVADSAAGAQLFVASPAKSQLLSPGQNHFALTSDKQGIALVGPEGGFTPEENMDLAKRGFTFVFLGETILRTETAAIVLAAHFREMQDGPRT